MHLKLNDQAQRTVLCKDPFRRVDERVDKLIAEHVKPPRLGNLTFRAPAGRSGASKVPGPVRSTVRRLPIVRGVQARRGLIAALHDVVARRTAACGSSDSPGSSGAKASQVGRGDRARQGQKISTTRRGQAVAVTRQEAHRSRVAKPFTVASTQSKVDQGGLRPQLAEGQEVVVDYVGINGRDSKEFDSSWKNGAPSRSLRARQGLPVQQGLRDAARRQAGRQPGAHHHRRPKDGYGANGQPQAGIKGTDSLVFVIDVKKATSR